MDKKFFIALVLTAFVVVATPMLFPSPEPTTPPAADSTRVTGTAPTNAAPASAAQAGGAPSGTGTPTVAEPSAPIAPAVRPETTVVVTPHAHYAFSNIGAEPVQAQLPGYRTLPDRADTVQLVREGQSMLSYAIAVPGDTIALHDVPFQLERGTAADGAPVLTYRGVAEGAQVALTYTFAPDSYLVRVRGTVAGVPQHSFLLVSLPRSLRSNEADSLDDQGHLAYAFKPTREGAESIPFRKLEPGDPSRLVPGPITWTAAKSKYFVVGLLTDSVSGPFSEMHVAAAPRSGKVASQAHGTVVAPIGPNGFSFEMYAGPQEWKRLRALGRDFDTVNPYGGFMQPLVQPFATIVMRILLWMKQTTSLNYGWVLVIFGVAIRLMMWPLNQGAMKSSLKMQELQPKLQEVQKRYKDEPEKQRTEIMRVYKENDASPWSTLSGCLPMLLPMPVLFALFFVFQNTIEFRGVPFLWLVDISLKDPLYVLPLLMGLTTFLVSWIGMRGMPPNPQAKMMAYVMPAVMTVVLINMPSGLNLYYTVQNLAALPQQWLIARERERQAARRNAKAAAAPVRPEEPPARSSRRRA